MQRERCASTRACAPVRARRAREVREIVYLLARRRQSEEAQVLRKDVCGALEAPLTLPCRVCLR
jgi:hypothetical protein